MIEDPLNATIVAWRHLTQELAIVRIKPDQGHVPDFEPGQFTTLGLVKAGENAANPPVNPRTGKPGKVKLIRRAYSIASSPKEKRWMEFYVVVVPEGQLTPRLWALKEGDRVFMDTRCSGKFTLSGIEPGKDLLMVSTGTGIAPFVSMLKTYQGTGLWRKLVIVHGARLATDLGYREQLEELAATDESVVYVPTVTREPEASKWPGMRGRVHTVLEAKTYLQLTGHELSPNDAHIFLCGNPAMIDQCEVELQARGFTVRNRENPQGNVHFERYW